MSGMALCPWDRHAKWSICCSHFSSTHAVELRSWKRIDREVVAPKKTIRVHSYTWPTLAPYPRIRCEKCFFFADFFFWNLKIKLSAFFLGKSLLNSYRNCGLGGIKGLKPFGFPLFFGLRGGFPPPLPRAPSPHFVKAFQALLTLLRTLSLTPFPPYSLFVYVRGEWTKES